MSNKMLRILMVILLFLILLITVWVVRAGYADYFYTYIRAPRAEARPA